MPIIPVLAPKLMTKKKISKIKKLNCLFPLGLYPAPAEGLRAPTRPQLFVKSTMLIFLLLKSVSLKKSLDKALYKVC